MKYKLEVEIDLPRAKVIELFDNQNNLVKWQPTLLGIEKVSGEPGQLGAKTKLRYKMGKRDCDMLETVVLRNFPETYSTTYEVTGVWNRVDNQFIELSETKTLWIFESDFKCSGFLRILAFLMPGMFKKESAKMLTSFKKFAEAAA